MERSAIHGVAAVSVLVLLAAAALAAGVSTARPPVRTTCTTVTYQGPLVPDALTPEEIKPVTPLSPAGVSEYRSNPRIGFGMSTKVPSLPWAARLGASWYLDWSVTPVRGFQKPDAWQMVRVSPSCINPTQDYIRWFALHYPGQVWLIGNEPDVIWQDNTPPDEYARIYHDLYTLIKGADPSATISAGGIAQATPLRLEYLDRVLKAYRDTYGEAMPVDLWNIHGYVLREERGSWGVEIPPGLTADQGRVYEIEDHGRLDLFEEQISAFRTWMAANGYQNTPLALTEFGILMPAEYGYPPERIAGYLRDTFNWLSTAADPQIGDPADGYHLVQRWAWFSLSDNVYPVADLADLRSAELTILGEAFRQAASTGLPSNGQ